MSGSDLPVVSTDEHKPQSDSIGFGKSLGNDWGMVTVRGINQITIACGETLVKICPSIIIFHPTSHDGDNGISSSPGQSQYPTLIFVPLQVMTEMEVMLTKRFTSSSTLGQRLNRFQGAFTVGS
jgi:hypothetical protein